MLFLQENAQAFHSRGLHMLPEECALGLTVFAGGVKERLLRQQQSYTIVLFDLAVLGEALTLGL